MGDLTSNTPASDPQARKEAQHLFIFSSQSTCSYTSPQIANHNEMQLALGGKGLQADRIPKGRRTGKVSYISSSVQETWESAKAAWVQIYHSPQLSPPRPAAQHHNLKAGIHCSVQYSSTMLNQMLQKICIHNGKRTQKKGWWAE